MSRYDSEPDDAAVLAADAPFAPVVRARAVRVPGAPSPHVVVSPAFRAPSNLVRGRGSTGEKDAASLD